MINPDLFQALLNYSNAMKMMHPQQQEQTPQQNVIPQMIQQQSMPQMQMAPAQNPMGMYIPQNLSAMPQLDSGMGADQLSKSIQSMRKKQNPPSTDDSNNGSSGIGNILGMLGGIGGMK